MMINSNHLPTGGEASNSFSNKARLLKVSKFVGISSRLP